MARETIEVVTCDVCRKKIDGKVVSGIFPVIFHTDQTEGRGCDPYLTWQTLDMHEDCVIKATNIHGSGAQGYNDYQLRSCKALESNDTISDMVEKLEGFREEMRQFGAEGILTDMIDTICAGRE